MGGAVEWVDSLPLLPAGNLLFDALPARAIVLDALAPAIGEGIVTVADGSKRGVLVIRGGGISDAVSVDGARRAGDAAMLSIRGWDEALVSAAHLSDEAMSILAPLLSGRRCYEDLRLEWTRWSELMSDLRARGSTYVVEVRTTAGRGVTVIRAGQQVATYTDAHPSIGDPHLIDALTAAGAGSLRVLVASETTVGSTAISATGTWTRADDAKPSEEPLPIPFAVRPNNATLAHGPASQDDSSPDDTVTVARTAAVAPPAVPASHDEGNATLTALFGDALGSQTFTPMVLDRLVPPAPSSVASLLPELKLLVQQRLQRSAGRVDDVVDAAADGGESVAWLADRVRVMTVRGFMTSTFEQLAEDMLALTRE